ncbi:MAG: TrbC/VirB2 family protein [Sedimenticola sp.]
MLKHYKTLVFVGVILLLMSLDATAGTTDNPLPWEGALDILKASITGPVALAISLIAIVVGGGMLIWGGELNDFARRMVVIVLVLAMIVAASNLLNALFAGAGALI